MWSEWPMYWSIRRQQYVWHSPDWPSSAAAAHSRQHYCAVGPVSVRAVADQYSLATEEQTNELMDRNRRTSPSRNPHLASGA